MVHAKKSCRLQSLLQRLLRCKRLHVPSSSIQRRSSVKLPDQITWGPVTPAGNQQAVLFGDPNKPGLYGVMVKWLAGNHFSKPHFHPNDRFITVLSGTWWVGSGPDFDPANASVPMPAGSFVTHYGKQVHWDGAKDVDAVLLIVGDGPATSTPFWRAADYNPLNQL